MAEFFHIPLFFAYIGCILFLLAALFSLNKRRLFFLTLSAAVFLAGYLNLANARIHPSNHIANFLTAQPQKVYIRGKVVSSPEVSPTIYHSQKTSFVFQIADLKIGPKWQRLKGLINANLYGQREVRYGDELLVEGLLVQPPGQRNPGGFDYQTYLANQNIFGLLEVKEEGLLSLRGRSEATDEAISKEGIASLTAFARNDGFMRTIFQFKQKLRRIIFEQLPGQKAALLSAILLGERSRLSSEIKDLFINTGAAHILAISGLHVGLIALILIALLGFLRLGRRTTLLLAILILIAYALLTGARPSVARATIMAVAVLFGLLLNRETNIYNSLGLAALLILAVRPANLFNSGFQLSFLSIISLVYFGPKIERLFPQTRGRIFSYLSKAFSVSLAAWLAVTPIMAYYFNIVSPIAVLANLVIIPYLILVVGSGICFLSFACLWPRLGVIFAQTSGACLSGLINLAALFSKIPYGFFHCPKPSVLFFFSFYALLLLVFNYQKLKISPGKVGVILLLAANFLVWRPLFQAPGDKLKVTFFDVGHADAFLIEFPYSEAVMLIDGGNGGDADDARRVILPALWNKGLSKIDAVVLTHPDDDHVGGLAGVLNNIQVNYVFDNGMPKDSIDYYNYKQALVNKKTNYRIIKQGQRISGFRQVELFALHPPRPFLSGEGAKTNNNSLVLKLVYGKVSFLFCGDIQQQAMGELLAYGSRLKSTVLKAPHHGSNSGEAGDAFFQAVSPRIAVISVDKNNRFGLPAKAVLGKLAGLGAKVYKTSDSGAVIISTDGRGVWVETMVK